MPEAINVANTRGFWIKRETPPGRVLIRSRSLVRPEDNKENIPPSGYFGSKRSPLPTWYPRTPLRDITAIYNAVQRRRIQEQAAMAAANEERGTESSAENVTKETVVDDEATTPTQNPPCIAESSSPVEHPLPTPSTSTDVDDEAEAEKKLTKSIQKIEEIIKNLNPDESLKVEAGKKKVMQRKTLMSMR